MIVVRLFKAGYGDTILVTVTPEGEDSPEVNILIDCGFNFQSEVIPVLEQMRKDGKKLDRLIITHFDKDHIEGAYKFINENGDASSPVTIKIDDVWLNTFRHLQFAKREINEHNGKNKKKIMAMIAALENDPDEREKEIGAWQASKLGSLLYKYHYNWNGDFDHQAVCIENQNNIEINNNVELELLSPDIKKLTSLEKKFISALEVNHIPVSNSALLDDAFEVFSIYQDSEPVTRNEGEISTKTKELSAEKIKSMKDLEMFGKDTSPGNGSSISFILKNHDRKILFLADAQTDIVISQLRVRYPDPLQYPIVFDAIKVSHHGSLKNCDPLLLQLADSGRFLFSTDGNHPTHKHPDIETIAIIIDRPLPKGVKKRELIFNYPLDHLASLQNEDLMKQFNYSVIISQEIKI